MGAAWQAVDQPTRALVQTGLRAGLRWAAAQAGDPQFVVEAIAPAALRL